MKTVVLVVILVIITISSMSSIVMADIFFDDGESHDINYEVNENIWATGGSTVNLLTGGDLPYTDYVLYGTDNSKINIAGGRAASINISNTSQLKTYNGLVSNIYATDSSKITIFDGQIGLILVYMNSLTSILGGHNIGLETFGSSQSTMSGGSLVYLFSSDSSQTKISGGSILEGCSISGTIFGESNINIDVGLLAQGNSTIVVSGGQINSGLYTANNGTITIIGSNFSLDGNHVEYGDLRTILGAIDTPSYLKGRLTGTLLNGELIDSQFGIFGRDASIKLASVPEPSSLVALLGGVSGLIIFKRRKR